MLKAYLIGGPLDQSETRVQKVTQGNPQGRLEFPLTKPRSGLTCFSEDGVIASVESAYHIVVYNLRFFDKFGNCLYICDESTLPDWWLQQLVDWVRIVQAREEHMAKKEEEFIKQYGISPSNLPLSPAGKAKLLGVFEITGKESPKAKITDL